MLKVKRRLLKLYETSDRKKPFQTWIEGLKDRVGKYRILTRLDRVSEGNFGQYRNLGEIYELKENFGPGYRIYFGIDRDEIILLLVGGDKSSQAADVEKAKIYWRDYEARRK